MNNLYKHLITLLKDGKIFLLALTCIVSITTVNAQVATYDFENPGGQDGSQATNAAASSDANVTASVMSKGSGLAASTTTYDGGFNAFQWPTASAIDANDYYEFTVTPGAGFEMDLTSIVFDETQNDTQVGTGNYFWTIRSSLDGYATDIVAPTSVNQVLTSGNNSGTTSTGNTVTLPASFLNITSALTFRIYAYDVSDNLMDWGIDNVVINGSINDIAGPVITSVAVPANATYIATQDLNFTVNFDENVTVNTTGGTPQLSLTIGASTEQAVYQSGSGSGALLFTYTVQVGDLDTDGIAVGTLSANGGTLKDAATNDANLTLNSVGSTASVNVDAVVPTVTSVAVPANATYIAAQDLNFTVNFSENITVNTTGGTPQLSLTIGASTEQAIYQSGSGSGALLFTYTVQVGDLDTDGIAVGTLSANGGTLKDAATNDANLTLNSVGSTASVNVDAVVPTVTSVAVPANATYIAAQDLNFTVNFSENITVNTTGGTPQLSLTIGASTKQAIYQSGSGSGALLFTYTVQVGDLDTDGIAVGTLSANGGTLRDAATNDANLTLNSVGSTASVNVDAVVPTVTSVAVPANATYIAAQDLNFTVNFSENVTVNTTGGTPQLSLTIGASTKQAIYQSGSGSGALLFTYTVQVGDLDTDGIAVGTLSANGGTLRDAATNDANLILNSVGSTASVNVDAVVPTVTSVAVPANATYIAAQDLNFTVNFSENITVNTTGGTPQLSLTIGASTKQAIYQSGSGSGALLFTYTVQVGDLDTDGIAVGTLSANGGTLKDAATNDANLTLNSVGSTASVNVDAVVPTVTSVAVPANATYIATQDLNFTVNFDENVTVNTTGGTPQLSLTIGASTEQAVYQSGSGSGALLFTYTIQVGDLDTDGIAVGTLSANGGTLKDADTNDANLTLNSVGSTASVNVDAVVPTVTSVAVPANATYIAAQDLNFTVNFSENITVNTTGGTPQLSLTIGASTKQAIYQSGSGSGALLFTYTVQVGDLDTDGIAVGILSANGGTLKDAATNDANLTLNSVGSTASVDVDAVPPSFSSGTVTNVNKNKVVATFNDAITLSDATGFSVGVTSAGPILGVSGTGTSTLTFTLTGNVISGDGITLIYSGGGDATDIAGNGLNTFNTALTNNVAPIAVSAEVNNGTPKVIEVTFDDNITISTSTGFNVIGISGETFSGGITGSGSNVISFDMGNKTVSAGDIISLDYGGGSDAQNGTAISLPNFSGLSITNNIAVKPEPAEHVSVFTATESTTTSINLTWTESIVPELPENYLIVGRNVTLAGTYATAIDGTAVVDDSNWADGNFALNVVVGTTNQLVSSLISGHEYQFRIYPYTNSGTSINYKTDLTIPEGNVTLSTGANTTITGGTGAASLLSLVDTKAEATATNFEFVIDDDGASDGVDNAPTLINKIVIQRDTGNDLLDWTEVISGAIFEDNGTGTLNSTDNPTQVVITSSAITISNIPTANTTDLGYVADDGTKTYSLKIWLRSDISSAITIDEKDLVFTVAQSDITVETTAPLSSSMATSNATSGTSNNTMAVVATKLIWFDFPASVTAAHFEFSVTVRAVDPNNNIDVGIDNKDVYMHHTFTSSTDPEAEFESDGPSDQGNLTPLRATLQNGQFTATRMEFHKPGNYIVEARTPTWAGPWDLTTANTGTISVATSDNESDIVASGFSPPDNIAYNLYQAADITNTTEGIKVGEFTIRDGGADLVDADASDTDLNEITFSLTNSGHIRQVALFEGTNLVESKAGAASITFSGLSAFSATDGGGGTPTLSLYVSFVSSVTDNTNFQFQITAVDASGSTFAFTDGGAGAGGAVTPLVLDDNRIEVAATKLIFTTEPSTTAFTIANLVQAPEVSALDPLDNLDLDYGASAIGQIGSTDGLTMSNIPTSYTSGILTFPANFQYVEPGNGTLTVTDINAVLTQAGSNTVTVSVDNETDIIANAGFTYPTNIAYQNYRVADIDGDGAGSDIEVARFDIRDGGSDFVDSDGSGTELTEITFDLTNFANIKNVALYNGAVELGEVIAGATVTFTGLNVLTADGGSTTLRLFVTFNDIVTDNDQFAFTVNNTVTNSIGSSMATANAGGAVSSTAGAINTIVVTATELRFVTQPSLTFINEVMAPATTIEATDVIGSRDLDYSGNATITTSGSQSTSPTSTLTSGFGTVSDINHDATGTSLKLTASDNLTLLTSGLSNSFNIDPGSAESDITASSFTYNTNILYKDNVGASVANSDPKVFQFDINDGTSGGTGTDTDILATNVTSLSFSVSNPTVLQKIGLFDNSNTLLAEELAGASITFNLSGTPVVVPDNGSVTLHLRATFNNIAGAVADNTQFSFTVSSAVANGAGSSFESADGTRTAASAATSSISGNDNRIEVVADRYIFTTQPDATVVINNNLITQAVVEAQDVNANIDVDYTAVGITYSNANGLLMAHNGGVTTGTTLNFTLTSGKHTLPADFQYLTAGAGNGTLTVTDGSITDGTSNSVTVTSSSESKIIEDNTFTYPVNIAYNILQEANIDGDDVGDIEVARYTIVDGDGVTNDSDGAGTTLTSVTFGVTNPANVRSVALYDGAVEVGSDQDPSGGSVTFNSLTLTAADDATKNFTVRISYNSSVTDNQQTQLTITAATTTGALGSTFALANAGGAASSITGDINRIEVSATKLVFTTEPSTTAFTIANLVQVPEVSALDPLDNLDLDYGASAVGQINNTDGLIMSNIPTSYTNGVLTFPANFQYLEPGNGTLTVTDINVILTQAGSNSVTVSVDNQSDIIENAAFTYTSNIIYQNYREADINGDGSGDLEVARFDIRDGGATFTDQDGSPTELTEITFGLTNFANIKNVALYNGAVELGEVAAGATVTFSSISASTLTDGGSLTLSLFVTFNDVVTDNDQFEFTVTNALTNSNRSSFANADAGGAASTTTTNENRIEVTADRLVFTQQPPATANALVDVSPTPVVQAQDVLNNVDLDFVEAIISITNARVTPEIPMVNLPAGPFALGELAFPANFQYTEPSFVNGDGQLTVTTASFSIASNPVNVVVSELSDIIEDASFTYPTNFDYLPYDVETDLFQIAQYTLTDGGDGNGNDGDNADTELTSLTLNFANFSSIRQVAIYEGGTIRSDVKTLDGSGNVTFNAGDVLPLSISAADNGTTSLNVRVNFNTTVTDNEQFTVEITGVDQNLLKSRFADPVAAGGAITILGADDNKIEVLATQFVYTTVHPSGVSIDTPYGLLGASIPVVEAWDVNNNLDPDFDLTLDNFSNNSVAIAGSLAWTEEPRGADGSDQFINGVFTYPADFEFDEDSQGNTDVIIDMTTNAGRTNSDGDVYGEITTSTPGFEVSAAESSLITLDAANPNHSTFDYIDFNAPVGNFDGNSYDVLANFLILDEDVVPGFTSPPASNDLAPTILTGLEINVTNFENIKEIALLDDGGTFYYGTDVGLGNYTFTGFTLIAQDLQLGGGATGMINFSIVASYNSSLQNPDTDDGEELQVTIVNAISGGGSKFDDTDDTGNNDAGGTNGIAITPVGTNIFNVRATLFNVLVQPAALEGVNIPTQEPQISAIDANGALDLGFNFPVTISAASSMTNVPASFGNINPGTLNFPDFQYTQTGNGTLTIAANGISIITTPVDVIHTTLQNLDLGAGATQDNNGISTQFTLPAGAVNRALLGFSITADQTTTGEPKLNEITIRFGNSITGIIENIRIFRSADSDYSTLNNTDLTGSLVITPGVDFINITGFSDEITLAKTDRYYFLVVDIGQTANFSSPHITPQIVASGEAISDVVLSAGSVSANILGREYGFNDINPPIVTARVPSDGSNNFPFSDLIEIQFGEKVIPQQTDSLMISIYKYIDDSKIGDYKLDKNLTIDSARFFFNTSATPLEGDTKYYILIANGVDGISGFIDKSGNSFPGYSNKTEWSFTTSDNIAPVFDPDKLPVVTYRTDVGFDLKVALDEPGKIFYIVVDPDATPDTPTVDQIRDGSFLGKLDFGEADIIKGFEYHYVSIINSSIFPTASGNFRVWVTAEDIAAPLANKMAEGTQLSVDDQFGPALGQVTVQTTTEDICLGDPQIILSPIYITESTDGDFTGTTQTINFVLSDEFSFDVNSTTANIFGQGGDITIDTVIYLNSSVLQITYSAPTTNSRDKIVISNLEIKASSTNIVGTKGSLIRLGGTGLTTVFPDLELIAEFNTSEIEEISFFTVPSSSTIGNDIPAVALRPDTTNVNILLGIGTNTFIGDGVVGDTLFTSGLALNVPKNIVFEYKDEFGCAVTSSKSITIFDANQAIIGLDNIQCTDQTIDIIEINGRAPQFLLTDLQVDIPNDEDPGAFDINVVLSSLTINADGDYEFNPGLFNTPSNYALFSGEGGKIGTLLFTGTYQDQQNTTIIESLEQRVDIYIPPVSAIIFLDQGSEFATEYCENDGSIRVDGNPKPATGVSVGFFAVNNDPNHPALFDNGDGSASIDPFIAGQQGYGFIDVSYSFQNLTSSCDSTVTQQIRVNPNPIANFTNNPGCVKADFNFDNLSTFPNSTAGKPNIDPEAGSVIDEWSWNFDDLVNSGGDNVSSDSLATHIFDDADIYDVSLIVTSDRGCLSAPAIVPISIGNNPEPSFTFSQVAVGTPTTFTSTTPSDANATLDSLAWTIDDVFTFGTNSNFTDGYAYPDFAAGEHTVILTAITDKNCTISETLDFFTVPEYVLSENVIYDEDFDGVANSADEGGWIAWGPNSSWDVGLSGGDSINTIPQNNQGIPQNFNFWVTGVDALYNNNEISYVYSPVFDITDLERPTIQLLKFAHLSSGVVIEYTAENLSGTSEFGIDSLKWKLLGELDTGKEWYNKGEIETLGGNVQGTGQFGWSGSDRESDPTNIEQQWKTAKHVLDEAKSASLDGRVQFRIGFKSGASNLGNFNGFAFDNVLVGNRTRIVLLENFTNSQISDGGVTKDQNDSISVFQSQNSSLAVIEYHPDISIDDPLSDTPDADARALYYGIGTTPRVAIDGVADPNNIFEDWGPTEYNVRSLDIAPMNIATTVTTNGTNVEINTTLTANKGSTIAANYIVHTVIVENQVTMASTPTNETVFNYVVRKMLPSASGIKFENILVSEATNVLDPITWSPTDAFSPGDISVVVFVQDEATKLIYQADIIQVNENIITSLSEELDSNGFAIWPNPANDIISLQVNRAVNKDKKVTVFDQLGKIVYSTHILVGESKVEMNSQNWNPGIYYIQTEHNGELIQSRILVQHR
jgi:Secretion system C-terminal sorting domain/Bacterial Ig-like domain